MLILAVIYLGSNLPKYVIRNLEYLRDTFKSDEIYFISDSKKSIQRATNIGVKTWHCPDPGIEWGGYRDRLDHPIGFRDGFWFKTLARFFVLDSFMQIHPGLPCLQIEADVFLFPYFPVSHFYDLEAEIAFPMESSKMGIASLLYLKNENVSSSLTKFALAAINDDGHVTDMSLLGKIAISDVFQFLPLPTLPNYMSDAINQPEAIDLICDETNYFSGVFDGISVGQYLLGVDPRNSRGFRLVHYRQISHAINPEKLNFMFDENDHLRLGEAHEDSVVYNIHNHAKDLRIYEETARKKLLLKRIASSKNGRKSEFILSIFISSILKSLVRRLNDAIK